ncbi:hypothetical protein E3O42_04115 [Cryobacterium adonitolivorans]|uniref:Uncharacterized protein n=1 Tax=Cryobacterium adonitolivorans TaxID=1259189 RepID=A0A4R8WCV1_9MICO|nr:hypothetical protein [Cryobacterium adonitolivorans]TFC05047.1 hypothetical protein E3O42_04115 [Cryobacterium adonitolivorans]
MGTTKRIRKRLGDAIGDQRIVRIERKLKFADRIDGFVVLVGKRWALVARSSDGGFFDGYIAFRIRDVKRIKPDRTFESAYARTRPEWPPRYPSALRLNSTADLLQGLGLSGALLSIQKEKERAAMWIGTVDEVGEKYVYLHEVRPDATWHSSPLGYKLKAITSVEVGTHYLVGLAGIAGSADTPRTE